MPDFQQIKTEYAYGVYKGVDYGSKIRVLMRSPEAVMFVGYGLRVVGRQASSAITIAKRAKKDTLVEDRVREIIEKYFGDGAVEAAVRAVTTRGLGTILVNGGGEPLVIPMVDLRAKNDALYAEVSPTRFVDIEGLKTCAQCGGKLTPVTTTHWLVERPTEGQINTLEECQRLSNFPVVAVHGFPINKPTDWWPYIEYFRTWDGESYVDDTFCNDRCGVTYGRRAVMEREPLPISGKAQPLPRHNHESVYHFERKSSTIVTASGLRI